MADHPISQPTAKTFSVVDLAAALAGRLWVLEFQHPQRWQWKDVSRLFDSIVKGYPISNLLLWTRPAPAAEIRLGVLRIRAQGFQDGWWVVDGKQRLTQIADAIQDGLGFGLIDDDMVLRAVLARRGGNVTRDIRAEFSAERTREPRDFEGETLEQAYQEGELALYRAVRFLQEDAGVPHFAFLWPWRRIGSS